MTAIHNLSDPETESIINDPSLGFLGHLTPSALIPHHAYLNPEHFLQLYTQESESTRKHQADHWFLLTGVTQRVFDEYFLHAESGPFSRAFAYDPQLHRLLVATPESTTHSGAGMAFNRMVDRAAEEIGMDDDIAQTGRGCYTSETVGTKQPELAWQPLEIVAGRDNRWPSVVLEVVYSEMDARAKLQADLRYWFRAAPVGTLRIVLTLTINPRNSEIVIEKWERERGGADDRPHLEQRVVISRTEAGDDVAITGSPLIICRIQNAGRTCSVPLVISRAARTLSPNNITTRFLNHFIKYSSSSARFEAVSYCYTGNVSHLYKISDSEFSNHAISIGPAATPLLPLLLRSLPCFTKAYQRASELQYVGILY
ncbi:hypothetical protein BJY00DRAFT_314204 [Aspergillus carlsbadensis]|nr:hypothetical protein BJY00DRAFT_314204 [Aspergillus carlsbadensis]